MRSAFDDLAFFDNENTIRGANGGEAVGNEEADAALENRFRALLNQLFGLGGDGVPF